jgi:predicted amidohydrolase
MRVCLVPLRIEVRNPSANLRHFRQRLTEIVPHQPDMICLPECAFTGYLYEEQDLESFAEPIPGDTTDVLSRLAKANRCYICFGMLEKAEEGIYSSAVLFDKSGEIVLVHRKINEKPPFASGCNVQAIKTEFGNLSVLLCGDLFSDDVKVKLPEQVEWLILPMARSFDGKSPDLERWLREERQAYVDEVRKVGITTLIVNSLEDPLLPDASFGGAMIISRDGKVLAESTHGTDEALIFDLRLAKTNGG